MSIDRPDFENMSEADLQELLDAQVPENIKLEYKRDMYGTTDTDRRELLKDVSAFANTQGGHLIIGIGEQNGIPASIDGVVVENSDATLRRIEDIIRTGLEPRIQNIRNHCIPLANGNSCIVIRVPSSWQKPHRVITGGVNRFHVRNERNVTEPNVEELKMLFSQNGTVLEQARRFRDQRIKEVINGTAGGRPLAGNGRFIMHIIPLAAFSGFQVDLGEIQRVQDRFRPIGALGYSPNYNLDGYILARGGDQNNGYTQIFRNGIVEVTKADIVRRSDKYGVIVSSGGLERPFFEVFDGYITALRDAGVPTPLMLSIALEGVSDAYYGISARDDFDGPPPPFGRELVVLPECMIEDYAQATTYHPAVKPAFDALWNASGYASANSFNEDGVWVGPRR